ncbi:uncharacterized protein LOC133195233 [Saccostrea echinata]|uniref:uncharacterized protein LOC133195233 n=1 Tax=Saccostrea echinata TaxID=191078 RepID=UPI002A82EFDB|nr:uncharacterized protein LOC133195233 [Saccostrea echinata]
MLDYREDVVTKEESSAWQDLCKGGTIPTAASLRVPPARIGLSAKQDLLQGLNSQEVSERYIMKLQKERERTNKAVSRSLDNLPIKIKKMVKEHTDSDLNAIMNVHKNGSYTWRSRSYQLGMGTKYDECNATNHLFQAMPINSLCKHTKRNCSKCHKQFRGRRTVKHDEKDLTEIKTITTDTDTRTSGYDSEFDFVYSQLGDQSTRSDVSLINGFPVRMQQNLEEETLKDLNDFQKRYQKMFDANRNVHFVHSSLVNNKRVKRLQKYNTRPKLKGSHVPTEEYSIEMMNIRSMQNQSLQKYTRKSSLHIVAPPQSRISELTDYQTPHFHLSDYSYSDADDEDEGSDLTEKGVSNPNVPRLNLGDNENDFEDYDDESSHMTVSNSRPNSTKSSSQKFNTVSDDLKHLEETDNVLPLSISALQRHNAGVQPILKQNNRNFPQVCNLTDITEREESNLTRSTKTKAASETPADVRMSIRIAYKTGGDDVIRELSNISSEEIMVPRWSRQDINCDVIEENSFSGSRESGLSRNSSAGRKVQHGSSKGLHTGYSNLYQESMRDIADTINAAQQAMDFIDQTLASSDKNDSNVATVTPGSGDQMKMEKKILTDNTGEMEGDEYFDEDQGVTPIDDYLKSLKIESPQMESFTSYSGKTVTQYAIKSHSFRENGGDKQNSCEGIDEKTHLRKPIGEKGAFFVTDSNQDT